MSKLAAIGCFLVGLSSATAATAATRPEPGVSVDVAARRASGRVESAQSLEPIGCRVAVAFGMSVAVCSAREPAGRAAQCQARDPDLVDAAMASRQAGFLAFSWDEAGQCTSIASEPAPAAQPPGGSR